MNWRLLLSLAVLVLLSSPAFAAVYQSQQYTMPATNLVFKSGGVGSVVGQNLGTVVQDQGAFGGCGDMAVQQQTGALSQGAAAAGMCGWLSVCQEAVAEGSQSQGPGAVIQIYPTPPIPQIQEQDANVGMGQAATKDGGTGTAVGTQAFLGGQNQMSAAPGKAVAGQAQTGGAAQYGMVGGGPCSSGTAVQSVDVSAEQDSLVSEPGPCPAPSSPLPCVID